MTYYILSILDFHFITMHIDGASRGYGWVGSPGDSIGNGLGDCTPMENFL